MKTQAIHRLFWPMALAVMSLGCVEKDDASMVGTLERDRHELKVEQSEPITAIHVIDGALISAGELVLVQDATRQQARLDQQMALLNQAAARLDELRRGPREESIREATARLEASKVRQVNAEGDLKRIQSLFERDLSNQSDLDDASAAAKTTAADVRASSEKLAALMNGTTIEELRQAEAVLAAAQATVRQSQLDLERLQIHAPVDGMVDRVLYKLGERPPVGSTVAVLLSSERAYARIYVPENLRARVQPGDELEVLIDGRDKSLRGEVRWVSSDASFTPYFALTEHDRSRLSFLAEVDLPGASSLPSGLPLEARIPGYGEE
jgi:HlyD family secretion protein